MEKKLVGAVVVCSDQGLGYLAKDFYDHKLIDKVLIKPHSQRDNHYDWFPNGKIMSEENYEWFFEGLKSILFFETPFDWTLLREAKKRGIKTVLMPMYECSTYPFPYEPDVILAPSYLDFNFYREKHPVYLSVPVDKKFKKRKRAKVFVHNAGNGGLGGRNGTKELLEAMKYVKSPIRLIVRSQVPLKKVDDPRIEYRIGTFDSKTLYEEGDVFIFPEKFNGLSLPINEAYASGMAIMSTNRYPFNKWLPNEILIPVKGYKKEKIAVEFDYAIVDPKDIAETIDKWYGKDISQFTAPLKWRREHSWKHLKPFYEEYLK